jgi:beta-aspartyl-dipeptidase (metallo-type)
MLFISEIIGAGEIAISDERSTDPAPHELARLVSDTHVGGMLARKAGVTHFHVGPKRRRLAPLRSLLNDYDVDASWLYPTHVERSEELLREAVDLTKRGATVDIDTVEQDLPKWVVRFRSAGGDLAQLTVSSDASLTRPSHVIEQLAKCVKDAGLGWEEVLPLATSNTARVLKLSTKGSLHTGMDADVVVLDRRSFTVKDVFAAGRQVLRDGMLVQPEAFACKSDREFAHNGGASSQSR